MGILNKKELEERIFQIDLKIAETSDKEQLEKLNNLKETYVNQLNKIEEEEKINNKIVIEILKLIFLSLPLMVLSISVPLMVLSISVFTFSTLGVLNGFSWRIASTSDSLSQSMFYAILFTFCVFGVATYLSIRWCIKIIKTIKSLNSKKEN